MLQYKDINGKTKNYKFFVNGKKVEYNVFISILLMMRNLRPKEVSELIQLLKLMKMGTVYTFKSQQPAFIPDKDSKIATFKMEIKQ
jgi:hypothetical protein